MIIGNKISFDIVIEFEPREFRDIHESINEEEYDSYVSNGCWGKFYKSSLEKIGILNSNFIYDNSWLISIDEFNYNDLKKLIKWYLNSKIKNDPDYNDINNIILYEYSLYNFFNGGYCLKNNGDYVILPNCCCRFESITDWEKIINEKSLSWDMIWIGHPWIHYKIVDKMVIFSDYNEGREITERFSVDENKLKKEIKLTKKKIKNFIKLLSKILFELSKEMALNISIINE
ncbi:MAG: hypothetical protein U0457_18955 [Candidatus Sericytochromatia bacterium]